jgi:uncharacterized protein
VQEPTSGGPVAPRERIVLLDVLRGVAVLGILLANIPYMAIASTISHPMGGAPGDGLADQLCYWAVYLVADTKFITAFSLLFGAGLALMHERADAAGAPFVRRYARRLGVLLAFGVLHGTLVWSGDILSSYALLGFVAILFRRCKVRTLLVWTGILFALGLLAFTALGALDPADLVEPKADESGRVMTFDERTARREAKVAEIYASGDFLRMAEDRAGMFAQNVFGLLVLFGTRTLAMFLLGIALVRTGLLTRPTEHRVLLRRFVVLGFGIGVPLEIVSVMAGLRDESGWSGAVQFATLYLGGFALAFAYLGVIARWCASALWPGLRARLAAVGRMALTSYLTHSVVTAVVFNYLGQFDRWNRPALLALVLAIFAFQLAVSSWWLARFRFGPVEWLWRRLTYGRAVVARRELAIGADHGPRPE